MRQTRSEEARGDDPPPRGSSWLGPVRFARRSCLLLLKAWNRSKKR